MNTRQGGTGGVLWGAFLSKLESIAPVSFQLFLLLLLLVEILLGLSVLLFLLPGALFLLMPHLVELFP